MAVDTLRNSEKNLDDELMQLCIQLLKDNYPRGLTIKEMSAKLYLPDPIKQLCKSSTVLSTKLNSFYRRCHPDAINSNPKKCPITRLTCPDTPNRLMYRYVKEEEEENSPERPISPPPEEQIEQKLCEDKEAAATTPPPHKPYQLRKVIKKTPHAFIPPSRRNSSNHQAKKAQALDELKAKEDRRRLEEQQRLEEQARENPYYDKSFTLSVGDAEEWLQDEVDQQSPEALSVQELDLLL
ncbi:hypothetical protein TRVA0_005S04060 [Trichomonascus vanleenenianus]|uniref:uncharacterized protein n=1 Tax=Trichomonascus vanleenenianus TaxID=2268995 RepID=UPI003EC9FF26